MELAYYPGCSLEATAKEYNLSTKVICKALGITLRELDDWVCCGATSAHSTSQMLALTLPAHNIAKAQELGLDVAIPCAACFNRMKKTEHALKTNEKKRAQIEKTVGFQFTGKVQSISMLEAIAGRFGVKAVAEKVVKPLEGLKVACYYGCLLVRPPQIITFDDPENPMSMDHLVKALGAEPVKWSYKTDCCGASLSLTATDHVVSWVTKIINMAEEAGAQALVTACPLCQSNLEMRRKERLKGMPAFYFTELIGLALDLPETNTWLGKHLIDPKPLLRSLSLMR